MTSGREEKETELEHEFKRMMWTGRAHKGLLCRVSLAPTRCRVHSAAFEYQAHYFPQDTVCLINASDRMMAILSGISATADRSGQDDSQNDGCQPTSCTTDTLYTKDSSLKNWIWQEKSVLNMRQDSTEADSPRMGMQPLLRKRL